MTFFTQVDLLQWYTWTSHLASTRHTNRAVWVVVCRMWLIYMYGYVWMWIREYGYELWNTELVEHASCVWVPKARAFSAMLSWPAITLCSEVTHVAVTRCDFWFLVFWFVMPPRSYEWCALMGWSAESRRFSRLCRTFLINSHYISVSQSHCTRGLQYPKQSDRRLTGSSLLTGFDTNHR